MTERVEPSLREYVKAGYPCLFLPTVEPEQAENKVKAVFQELGLGPMPLGIWKATTGLMMGRIDGMTASRMQTKDLIQALAHVETSSDRMVVVFHNLRKMMENYQVIQQMVDTTLACRLKGSYIILVGAYLDLPPELKGMVTYIECPLPTRDQIASEYRRIISAYRDEVKIPKKGDEYDQLIIAAANAAVGMDSIGAENALALSLVTANTVDLKMIQAQKEQEVKKSDVLEFIHTDEGMDTLGGFSAMKTWFLKRRRVFTQEARDYGLPYPKGVLIVGPAGTGKSLAAKAIASYLQLLLLRLDMGKIFRSLVGESEAAIRQALKVAEAVAPVVVWIDEIEKGMAGMKGSGELDSGVTSRVLSTLLTWRQETKAPVMFVATANDVVSLPSMVYRRGRFDEVWATDLPSQLEREEIFRIHLHKRKRDPEDFDVPLLAQNSQDFTGSEVESVIEDGMFSAFDQDVEVGTAHILKAVKNTIPQAVRDAEELTSVREWVKNRARLVSGVGAGPQKKGEVRQLMKKKGV